MPGNKVKRVGVSGEKGPWSGRFSLEVRGGGGKAGGKERTLGERYGCDEPACFSGEEAKEPREGDQPATRRGSV